MQRSLEGRRGEAQHARRDWRGSVVWRNGEYEFGESSLEAKQDAFLKR